MMGNSESSNETNRNLVRRANGVFFPEVRKDSLQEFKLEMNYHLFWDLSPHSMRQTFARTRRGHYQDEQTFMHALLEVDSA